MAQRDPARLRRTASLFFAVVAFTLEVAACTKSYHYEPVVSELNGELVRGRINLLLDGATVVKRVEKECQPSSKSAGDRALDKGFGVPSEGEGQATIRVDFTTIRSVDDLRTSFRLDADRLGFSEKGNVGTGPDFWAEYRIRTLGSRRTGLLAYLRTKPPFRGYLEISVACDQLRR
jgi:hypothetical protein